MSLQTFPARNNVVVGLASSAVDLIDSGSEPYRFCLSSPSPHLAPRPVDFLEGSFDIDNYLLFRLLRESLSPAKLLQVSVGERPFLTSLSRFRHLAHPPRAVVAILPD